MLPLDLLKAALGALELETVRGTFYRATRMRYLPTLTSTEGGKKSDNRYSAKGLSEVLYVADGPDIAMLEATRQFQQAFGTSEIPTYAIYPVGLRLRQVLDLTAEEHRQALGTTLSELTGDWRAEQEAGWDVPTQRVGRAAFEAGCDAVKYPSAYASRRHNLVVFTEHIRHPLDFKLDDVLKRAIQHLQAP